MSIGLGIFLSALVFAFLYLYKITRDRWNWKRFAWRSLAAIGAVLLIGGLWIVIPLAYDKIRGPQPQAVYAGLRLGLTMDEVKYIKGYPPEVVQNPEDVKKDDNNPFSFFMDIRTKDFTPGQRAENYRWWEYTGDSDPRIDVQFDAPTKTLNSIMCYSKGFMSCPEILGVYNGADESFVIDKIGKPSSEQIDGVTKTIIYDNLNVWFYLEKQKVYSLGIKSNRPVDKAPPCKSGAQNCEPWERDWSKLSLAPGSTVTSDGAVTPPAGK